MAPALEAVFPKAALITIAVVAFALRAAYVWQIRSSPLFDTLVGDAKRYDAWAQQIAAGDWIGRDVFYQAPLYPYFLGVWYSLAGRDLFAVRLVQCAIGAVSCVLIGLASRRWHSIKAGWMAGIAMGVYAPAIFFDGLLQKSVLDLFFIAVLIWLVSRFADNEGSWSRWFGIGVTLGALALTRENAFIFIIPLTGWLFLQSRARPRRAVPALAALALGMLLVLAPVAVRNRLVGGEWHVTTSQFGPNFYLGNNPKADGTAGALREGRGSVEYERQDAFALAEAAEGRPLSAREVSSYWTRQALTFIRSSPGRWLMLLGRKTRLLFNRAELVDTDSQEAYEDYSSVLRALSYVANFGVLMPIAIFGMFVAWRHRRKLWLVYALALAYAASVVLFFVSARYRLPLVPFLMIFAAIGLSSVPEFVRSANFRRKSAAAAVVCVAAIVANWPLWPRGYMAAVTENNLAISLQGDNRVSEAESHYRRALELRPDYAPAYVNLGEVLTAQQRPEEAIEAYLRAGSLGIVDPELDGRIADAFLRAGRAEQAIQFYRRTLSAGNRTSQTYNNLIVALMSTNRISEALEVFPEAIQDDPNNANFRFTYGSLLLERQRYDEAAAQYRAGLALLPDSAEGHGNLGAALAATGKTREAIVEFERALALKPDLLSAQRNREIARKVLTAK
jgi:tetratricopeptide (TPR) repeat protein